MGHVNAFWRWMKSIKQLRLPRPLDWAIVWVAVIALVLTVFRGF